MDILNLTAGLHIALAGDCSLRVASVVPLKKFDDRFFDSELWVSFVKQL